MLATKMGHRIKQGVHSTDDGAKFYAISTVNGINHRIGSRVNMTSVCGTKLSGWDYVDNIDLIGCAECKPSKENE